MTRICWWLADALSRMLEPNEREVVRGDFAESGESAGAAMRDLLGLIARRQASLWKDWHPWLALVGLALPLGFLLSLISLRLDSACDLYFWIVRNYATLDPSILEDTGLTLRHGIAPVAGGSLLLASWSWVCGFVLGSLSRGTVWVNGAVFCLVPVVTEILATSPNRRYPYSAGVLPVRFYTLIFPLVLQASLIFLPALCGIYRSRRPVLTLGWTFAWAVAIGVSLVYQEWLWMLPQRIRLQVLAGYWPVGYMVAITIRQHRRSRMTITA